MVMQLDAPITADDIYTAADRIAGVTVRTPVIESPYFSQLFGCRIAFKLENLQRTGAFKLRGAYNKVASLTDDQRALGLIAASSGNHAQGVAYAAQAFGIDRLTTIFMPESTPKTKIDNTKRYGDVTVKLVSGNYDVASVAAHDEADRTGATYIEPYNDWDIIAGQGTAGLEIMLDAPDTDMLIVPVGGGGLISGIALAAKSIKPAVRVFGVGATYANPTGYTIADGIRVKSPGEKPRAIIEDTVEQIIRITETEIAAAVAPLATHLRIVAEGSGAVGLAALMAGAINPPSDARVVVVVSGGNIDLTRLADLLR